MDSVLQEVMEWIFTHFMNFIGFGGIPEAWNAVVDVITNVLNQDVFSWFNIQDGATAPALPTISTIIDALNPVAYALVTMIWFFGVLKYEASFQDLKRPEILFRHFFRFAISIALVALVPELISLIWSTGIGIAQKVGLGTTSDLGHIDTAMFSKIFSDAVGSDVDEVNKVISGETNILDYIGLAAGGAGAGIADMFGMLLIPVICLIVVIGARIAILYCGFQILSNIISRFFRIVLLYLLGPVAMSALASEGTQKISIQYLKNAIAVSVEVSLTVLLLKVFSEITNHICEKTTIPNAFVSMTQAILTPLFKAVFVIGQYGKLGNILYPSISTTLLLLLCVFILQSSIKGLDNIVDSLFGLRGV